MSKQPPFDEYRFAKESLSPLEAKQTVELRFNCWKCSGTHPSIGVTLEPRETEIVSIACPICRTPMFQIHMEARR